MVHSCSLSQDSQEWKEELLTLAFTGVGITKFSYYFSKLFSTVRIHNQTVSC